MLKENMKVKVFDGDLIGWTTGILVEQYQLHQNKWRIFTNEGSELVRYVKENYTELKADGCGYAIKSKCCPCCGSYNVELEAENYICYECDTYFN